MQTDTVADPARRTPAATAAQPEPRFGVHARIATGLIALGCLIRLGLIIWGWPATNSDEGHLGIMAQRIAYHGEHPIFYPGQNYMGPHEAVLGAVLFHLFGGPSLFLLRFGLLVLFAAFLTSSYLFARMVYGARWALVCLAVLALGSPYIMAREMSAIGGYGETLLFGSLMFLLAARLIVTYRPYRVLRECRWRLAAYAAWGVIAGTSIWSDLLGAPFVLMSGVALLVYCWREFLQLLGPLAAGVGLVLGAFPLIWFNLHAKPGEDMLSTLEMVRGNPPESLDAKLHAVWNAVRISVPMMTGEPFCGANELTAIGPATSWSRPCVVVRGGWGTGYMLLLGIACLLAAWGLWWAWRNRRRDGGTVPLVLDADPAARLRKAGIHVAMLIAAVITFYLYAFSFAAVEWPGIHGRYLIGFLIATPAILWPLWQGLTAAWKRGGALVRTLRIVSGVALAGYLAFLAIGTVLAYTEAPSTRADQQRDQALADTLIARGVTHFYTDYWICANIAFRTEERLTCAAVDGAFNPGPGQNRYIQYWIDTNNDPQAAYVFADDPCRSLPAFNCKGSSFLVERDGQLTLPVVEDRLLKAGRQWDILQVDGYVIYLVR
ncbi:hypothetical protein [Dactylosporangium sp. CA-233914]|uniref:hypothetical protein n=1 Tax=Dactylosporangium sp. CA-233914 TaxID=3239934 RepID=UPI003D8B44CA